MGTEIDALSAEIDMLMRDINQAAAGPGPAPSYPASTEPGPSFAHPFSSAAVTPAFGISPAGTDGGVGQAEPPAPGAAFVSTGPGVGFKAQASENINIAPLTPDGREVKVNTSVCDYCNKPIVGRITNAIGKQFHPEHFVCANCSQPFKSGKFMEHEGKPYCEDHYYELFAPRCYRCEQPIKETVVRALGHTWHPNHFTCAGCGIELSGKRYKEAGGEPYCNECKKNLQVEIDPKIHICARCKEPIIGWYVTLHGQRMHPEHFRCEACGKEFTNGDCFEHNGKFYCKEDYDKLQKANCAGCRKPIIGRSITALGRVWHPEHFCCTHCHTPFAGSQFFERDGLPYCELHFNELFGRPCAKCGRPVITAGVEALGKVFHKNCFTCQQCDTQLDPKAKICQFENKALCKRCYLKLPSKIRKQLLKKQKEEGKMERKRQKDKGKEEKQQRREDQKNVKQMKKEMRAAAE